MDTSQFDKALIAAVFQRAALVGWRDTTLVEAARDAALDLPRVRMRFPGKSTVLMRFGVVADQAVLATAPTEGTPREKLFDLVMSRFDQIQQHRDGMMALLSALPMEPATGLLLYGATLRSMRWMLDAAGIPVGGLRGALRVHGLAAVWGYGLRAWQQDESSDLPSTMAAVDRALDRAMQAEAMLPGGGLPEPSYEPEPAYESELDLEPGSPAGSQPGSPPMISGQAIAAAEDGPAVL